MAGVEKNYDPGKYMYLKPEAFCADLISNGFSFENMIFSRSGSFKKRFRKEIDSVSKMQNDDGDELVEIVINRDSIYDLLPEGLFHQPVSSNRNTTVPDMVKDFRRLKEEERYTRKFFQPLEQEFIRYTTLIEQEERSMMLGILGGNITESFLEFWNLPNDIPEDSARILARLMPWAYMIKGDLKLTAKALEMVLHKKEITIEEKHEQYQLMQENDLSLSNTSLGVDFVTGNCFNESSLCWIFTINDILANEMEGFTAEKPLGKLLKLFVEIFIPVQVDAVFEYETAETDLEEAEKIMGYGFVI